MRQVVVMPGGFHPFHAGHASLYQSAIKAFPDAEVYVAATNDTKTRPFPFKIKEKLAKVAGVAPGHFVQVKSPFKAEEITRHYNPNEDVLIFVRSEKDKNEQPKPGGTKKDGTSAYFQPWTGEDLQPFSQHAYMAYLPTVEFGPGITSATEIRNAWPKLNDKRKTAMVMSLYPATQKNPKLAANVVQLLDMGMGNELDEGWKEKVGAAALAGGVALGGLSSIGNASDTNWDKFPQQMRTQQDNSGNEKIMSVAGPNSKGEYRVRITAGNDVHEFITKTPPKGLKEEFRPSTSQAMNIQRQTRQKMNPGASKFVWKRPNQIGGSYTENELKSLNFKYSAKYNMWGGTQQMWDQLTGKINEFAPPSSGRDGGGGEDERSRRLRKLLEIAIKVAEEQNVGTLGKIHAMNTIAGDDFFRVAVQGILADITDREYMFVLESAYKTVKQGLSEGKDFNRCFDQACKLYDRAVSKNLEPKLVQVADFQGDGNGADPRWMKLPQHVWQHYVVIVGDQVLDPTAKQFGDTMLTQYQVSDLDRIWGKQYQIRPSQGVSEGDVVPFKQPSKALTWKQVPKDILLLANDWFWASEDNSGLDATLDPEGFGNGTANDVKYNAAKLQQKGWTIDYNYEYDGPGEFNLRLTNKRGQTVLLSIEDAQDFTGWAKGTSQYDLDESASLSVEQLAHISDKALDDAYHYGRSTPGANFGWMANMQSAKAAKRLIDAGVTDIEAISDAIHKGWNVTAAADYKGQLQLDTPTPDEKKLKRAKLAMQSYSQLPEDEKEKDRVVARALLQAIKGDEVTESLGIPYPTTYEQENNKFKRRGPMRITDLTEFAPNGSDDREPDEEILRKLAAMWWNGTEQQMRQAQQTLHSMGWDIGQDESGDDDAGVFVIRIGDEHGDSYISFPHSDLGLNEDYLDEK